MDDKDRLKEFADCFKCVLTSDFQAWWEQTHPAEVDELKEEFQDCWLNGFISGVLKMYEEYKGQSGDCQTPQRTV